MTHVFYPLIEHKRHLLLKDHRENLVIDTGSPVSFHEDGVIELGDCKMNVQKSFQGIVGPRYLSEKLGIEVKGLLGMDFMEKHTTVFNTKKFGGFISFDDQGFPDADAMGSFSVGGCPGIVMKVNGMNARMLVDSGANLSYIDNRFVRDAPFVGQREDFSPMLGTGVFATDTYEIPCHIGCGNHKDKDVNVVFGLPPTMIGALLWQNKVDGVIGYDLFSNFRVLLQNGQVALPPQGI